MSEKRKFDTIIFNKTTTLSKEGMELSAYIAGVNSGSYQLPYVIVVKTWARKWMFKKFFCRSMHLNLRECKILKEECEKVIRMHEERKK